MRQLSDLMNRLEKPGGTGRNESSRRGQHDRAYGFVPSGVPHQAEGAPS